MDDFEYDLDKVKTADVNKYFNLIIEGFKHSIIFLASG